jgi:hypothetical protein
MPLSNHSKLLVSIVRWYKSLLSLFSLAHMPLPMEVLQMVGKKISSSHHLWMLMFACKHFRNAFQPFYRERLKFAALSAELCACVDAVPMYVSISANEAKVWFYVEHDTKSMYSGSDSEMSDDEFVRRGMRIVTLTYDQGLALSIKDVLDDTGIYFQRIWVLDASVTPIRLVSASFKPCRKGNRDRLSPSYQGIPIESFGALWELVRSRRIMHLRFDWGMCLE